MVAHGEPFGGAWGYAPARCVRPVFEDHPDHRELGRALLTHLGARVDVAEEGELGLQKMRQECPDLVLCDPDAPRERVCLGR